MHVLTWMRCNATDIGKWVRPAISSHVVQWSSMQMRMPLETHTQQHCSAPDANFCNSIPYDLQPDMRVATEQAKRPLGLVRALSQGC